MAIGVYASTGGSGPYAHPLIVETTNMLQQWCTTTNDLPGIPFSELEYISGIQRYLEVDADDPTRIVDTYVNAWWHGECDGDNFIAYAFAPREYLEVHRPQVSNMFLSFI
jgi:hypothetical protein